MRSEFSNFQEVLNILHVNNVKYLILRNFDNLLTPDMYQDGHGDVDLLCEDSELLAKTIGAKYFLRKDGSLREDKTHYYITINGVRVSIDMRVVGDNYYCEQWQKDMLDTRIFHNGFYIMTPENLFYSLIYHAILQKSSLSNDYNTRLNEMKNSFFGMQETYDETKFIKVLEDFMRAKNYTYTYPKDILVPFRSSIIDNSLIAHDRTLQLKRWKYATKIKIIETLVAIKHTVEKCYH